MSYGVQLTSLAVIAIVLVSFFQYERIGLLSTKMFTGFLVLALVNNLAEFATLYTLSRVDTLPAWANRLAHQVFIGSLDGLILLLFFYVDIKARGQRRYTPPQLALRLAPALAALVMVLFGPLHYYIGQDARYSYGPMAATVYLSVAVYVGLLLFRLQRAKRQFTQREKFNLALGVALWAAIALYQFFHPKALLSSLAVAVMVAFVYISFENPREYHDRELPALMDRHALDLVLAEQFQRRRPFAVACAVLTNDELLRATYGPNAALPRLSAQAERMAPGHRCYRLGENVLCALLPQGQAAGDWHPAPPPPGHPDQWSLCALDCPATAADPTKVLALLEFFARNHAPGAAPLVINTDFVQKLDYHIAVEKLVQTAVQNDGLEVYYQPIYDTRTGKIHSAEALVRLKDRETLGFVSPEVFVPIAERRGLVGALGDQVFTQVCRFARDEKLPARGVEFVEVNLSGVQCVDPGLPAALQGHMRQYGIDPAFLNLEVTETASTRGGEQMRQNLAQLRAMGCHFSMDDFGTGYSNLAEMARNEYDLIKLDKSLLWPCFAPDGEKALVLLKACTAMMHSLGIAMVAEGVETKEQADLLTDLGVQYLQGYYFARPLPEQEFLNYLTAHGQ